MSQFKWTIEYTLSRTYPAFMYLTFMIDRVRADETIDGTYAGYVAGKYGEKVADRLFRRRGSFTLKTTNKAYTEEELQKAIKNVEQVREQLKKNV